MKLYQTNVGRSYFFISTLSIFLVGIFLQIMAIRTVNSVKRRDTRDYLTMVANESEYIYRRLDEGGNGFYKHNDMLCIGNTPITEDYTIIDYIKSYSNAEITFFCGDTRAITTIVNSEGERFINTKAMDVWEKCALHGETYFGEDVKIDGVRYFGYYKPLKDNGGNVVGMVFAGVPALSIEKTIRRLQMKFMVVCAVICALVIIMAAIFTTKYIHKLNILMNYLTEIDNENFSHVMPAELTKRSDEYGVLSRHMEKINASLKDLVQRDGLTMLYNRRTTMNIMKSYYSQVEELEKETFSVAIGDIDFFKNVNDTYGHACGDEVLKHISAILRKNIKDIGIAGRWGGEEFVLILDADLKQSREIVEKISEEIRSEPVKYKTLSVPVTMTFGLVEYSPSYNLDAAISSADKLLYKGKANGRNQVVV